ncbi:MAG: protoporphyrinogen oxidase [Bacillus sp. (in: firmicutes)]
MKKIVVVGGGITGLSTMYYLQKLKQANNLPVELLLVEEKETLGGKIHSIEKDDFIMETGADSIVARNKNVLPFVKELQLEDELVYNATGISYIHTKDQLLEIPKDSIFGIPMSLDSLFSSELVSARGKIEALKDLFKRNKQFTKETSIGEFLEYFFGKELVEKQIAPVLAGVYSGSLNTLTMASTLPFLLDYKNEFGSIVQGLAKNKSSFQSAANKKFISFKNGLSTIITRLEEVLTDVTIIKGVQTTKIRKENRKYTLTFSNHQDIEADSVILSTPHDVSQQLLCHDKLDSDFNKLKNSSNITMYLTYDVPDKVLPKEGTGFIVSEDSELTCNACTWTSRKWKHTSKHNQLLLRVFYKKSNPAYEHLNGLTEEELVNVAGKDIEKSLGIQTKPTGYKITKWNNLMPVYSLQHKEAVECLTTKLADFYPDIFLAGCSYYGVGIAACIANGEATAEKVANTILQKI